MSLASVSPTVEWTKDIYLSILYLKKTTKNRIKSATL